MTDPESTSEPKKEEKSLIVVHPAPIASTMRPAVTLAYVQETKKERDSLIRAALIEGKDYATIPGCKNPSLLQPGAQQVAGWFECRPEYTILSEDHDSNGLNEYEKPVWENGRKTKKTEKATSYGLHAFRIQCALIHRPSGQVVGSGVGACSTMESKYISRPNDSENTVLKMAKKRAFVDAVLTTFALSERFTQDVEDMDLQDHGKGKSIGKPRISPRAEEDPKEQRISRLRLAFKKTGLGRDEIKEKLEFITGSSEPEKWSEDDLVALEEFVGLKKSA